MKSVLFAAALMISGAALAQTTVAPANDDPERDARGIPVVSAPATAPAGANQAPAAAPAGAQVVPAANQAQVFQTQQSTESYPPCTREVTDNCVQTYERGVRRPG